MASSRTTRAAKTPPRATRAKPERVAPDRTGWAGRPDQSQDSGSGATANDASSTGAPSHDTQQIEDIVSSAVHMGYSVIEDHLRQGRAAADRMSAGSYGVRDVPDDLGQLGSRLLQAARDFSTMWFDFIEAGVRDPRLANALRRQPGGASARAKVPVTLTCSFPGKAATVLDAWLTQPEQPALLATVGLHSPDPATPPITSIVFMPGAGGVTAVIRIAKDHPAGTYSGVISDAGTHAPLGTISVKVDQ